MGLGAARPRATRPRDPGTFEPLPSLHHCLYCRGCQPAILPNAAHYPLLSDSARTHACKHAYYARFCQRDTRVTLRKTEGHQDAYARPPGNLTGRAFRSMVAWLGHRTSHPRRTPHGQWSPAHSPHSQCQAFKRAMEHTSGTDRLEQAFASLRAHACLQHATCIQIYLGVGGYGYSDARTEWVDPAVHGGEARVARRWPHSNAGSPAVYFDTVADTQPTERV